MIKKPSKHESKQIIVIVVLVVRMVAILIIIAYVEFAISQFFMVLMKALLAKKTAEELEILTTKNL